MITLTREEAQQVLDALDKVFDHNDWQSYETAVYLLRARLAQETPYEIGKRLYQEGKGISFIPTAVERDDQIGEALRGFEDARLAQPEPEPVAWIKKDRSSIEVSIMSKEYMRNEGFEPLYTAPPQREWQGLTDEELLACYSNRGNVFYRAIEAKLKEKNT